MYWFYYHIDCYFLVAFVRVILGFGGKAVFGIYWAILQCYFIVKQMYCVSKII